MKQPKESTNNNNNKPNTPHVVNLQYSNNLKSENLVVNPKDPFDNYCGMINDPAANIGEARTGSVYREYLRQHPVNVNELIFDLIVYMDRTNIDKNSRFTCCPVLFSSSLF